MERKTHHFTRIRRFTILSIGLTILALQMLALAQQAASDSSQAMTIVPAYRHAEKVVVITIEGPIDGVTSRSVERRMQYATDMGAEAVVFDINTPGGQVVAALEICQLIKSSPIPLKVAWVHSQAYSAGTIISLACDEIVMATYADLGDCAPIRPFGNLSPAERAKIESPLLAEAVDSARRHGYDEKLAMSFIAVDIELWLVENTTTGDRIFVDRVDYETIFGQSPPDTARKQASGGVTTPIQPGPKPGPILPFNALPKTTNQPDQPIPTPAEREMEIEMQQSLPSYRPFLTEADRGHYRLLEPVVDNKTLLLVKTIQAERYGLSKTTITDDTELKAYFGATELIRYDQSWSESLVQLLTSMPFRIGLIIIFAVGLIWEMSAPGVTAPGAVAAIALLLLLGAPALTGLAQWWDIALVFLGIILIGVELFIIPGFGVAGVAGLLALALGFLGTFVAADPNGGIIPTTDAARQAMLHGLGVLVISGFAVGVAGFFISRYLGDIPVISRLVLNKTMKDLDPPPTVLTAMNPNSQSPVNTGDTGVAITGLRPIGRADINGNIYDVVASHGSIEADTRIKVTESSQFRIVVEVDTNE